MQLKIVHQQLNNQIGLASEKNLETNIQRELVTLKSKRSYSAMYPSKLPSITNSAVLQAVEEEDQGKSGYKRVAWPPVNEDPIIRAITPQPPKYQHYESTLTKNEQYMSDDQLDFQEKKNSRNPRSISPGAISLRRETPITQRAPPIYICQPATAKYQGGLNMRGDLKWPPPEYKEAAARENEDRRKLALGPVCRPRKVFRDYTGFFAKNALNSTYPSYKVPPGTQHILA